MTTHGDTGKRLYRIYRGMVSRCASVGDGSYKRYGAKGISVCSEWKKYIDFKKWANANGYDDSLTIDRIDNEGNYEPSNCRWITQHEQVIRQDRNRHRTLNDKYIYNNDCGTFVVVVCTGAGNNRVEHIRQTCQTKEEAMEARDFFLEHGFAMELKSNHTPTKSILRPTREKEKRRAELRKKLKETK